MRAKKKIFLCGKNEHMFTYQIMCIFSASPS
jgi:hypothetical protein